MNTASDWNRYILARERLRNLGLDDGLREQLEQLAECGPSTALPIMAELERGGRDVIRRVNADYRRISRELARARGTATGTPSSPDAAQP